MKEIEENILDDMIKINNGRCCITLQYLTCIEQSIAHKNLFYV